MTDEDSSIITSLPLQFPTGMSKVKVENSPTIASASQDPPTGKTNVRAEDMNQKHREEPFDEHDSGEDARKEMRVLTHDGGESSSTENELPSIEPSPPDVSSLDAEDEMDFDSVRTTERETVDDQQTPKAAQSEPSQDPAKVSSISQKDGISGVFDPAHLNPALLDAIDYPQNQEAQPTQNVQQTAWQQRMQQASKP